MLLNAAITDLKLHAFSLVQTTIGFCKLCRTGSPVYHVVFNHEFSILFRENLLCPCKDLSPFVCRLLLLKVITSLHLPNGAGSTSTFAVICFTTIAKHKNINSHKMNCQEMRVSRMINKNI